MPRLYAKEAPRAGITAPPGDALDCNDCVRGDLYGAKRLTLQSSVVKDEAMLSAG